jgi:hypothetical protein
MSTAIMSTDRHLAMPVLQLKVTCCSIITATVDQNNNKKDLVLFSGLKQLTFEP